MYQPYSSGKVNGDLIKQYCPSQATSHHTISISILTAKISDSLIKQSTNPHIVNYPKIISQPSPCEINPELKLLTFYPIESERGCAKLEKPRMEKSYNGLKGSAVQSSQWMDVGQNKSKVWEVSEVLLWS